MDKQVRKQHWAVIVGLLLGALLIVRVQANDVAIRDILRVAEVWQELALYGQGQIVAVADTGLDTGDPDTLNDDFAGRVIATYALGRSGDWSDANGHGTHVAGSVLGSGRQSGSDPDNRRYSGSFAGVAPEAGLVFQSLLDANDGLGGLPEDLGDLYRQAYDAGARIHTNSWGANFFIPPLARFLTAGAYTAASVQTDRFVWEHQDMVILFAAGNEGSDVFPLDGVVDEDSIGSPGTAKNVITVGASENVRSSGGNSAEAWGEGPLEGMLFGFTPIMEPLISDRPSDNADGMALFSSRGPTNDGRIKPDVVAPGTNVLSVHSQHPKALELYGLHAQNDQYAYCSGTSMATPLAAGTTALIRQWYVETRGHDNPSAALIKATLINGAADISPGQYGVGDAQEIPEAWPNHVSGWGRVDLAAALAVGQEPEREVWFDDAGVIEQTEEVIEWTRYAGAGNEPIRITLVWTDPPGDEEPLGLDLSILTGERTAPALVNDLDLIVIAPDGREFLGNGERAGGGADRLNNVEAVRIPNPVKGEYRVIVTGYNIAQGPQPFALVMSGNRVVQGPPPVAEERFGAGGSALMWLILAVIGGGLVFLAVAVVIAWLVLRRRRASRQAAAPRRAPSAAPPPGAAPGTATNVPQRPPAHLSIKSGTLAGRNIPLGPDGVSIGREPQNGLAIQEENVSRQHARIELRLDGYYLVDQKSANGSFVNGQRVEQCILQHGDEIRIGNTALEFRLH